jgi:APA family basic amino acid/polyamine antiporter
MIGSGIFIVTSAMARYWFSMVVSNLVSNGLITVAAALSYGELGNDAKAGGQFVYIQRAYGRLVSFLYGWTVLQFKLV